MKDFRNVVHSVLTKFCVSLKLVRGHSMVQALPLASSSVAAAATIGASAGQSPTPVPPASAHIPETGLSIEESGRVLKWIADNGLP